MYPNLLGQKAYHKLTDAEMAEVIGVTRTSYSSKIKTGRFTPGECWKFCKFFGKSFEYLFATDDDVGEKVS